ncbi:IS110 family RNA-guided transposase [Spirosoma endophyticum]|uniref:Transposase n=1 Tax=Spirosoma endophyticum TaxID=662367 RepID=A0A1I2EUI8_9BACT|nr:IS110 family transposase [Spirosoma endophyticum]SFE95981.1 Transposase [Spirosoma endophyticum]
MDIRHFIGIDVSKNTLDWAVYTNKGIVWQTQSENSPTAIRAVIKQLQALPDFGRSTCVVCMEHTGLYNAHALDVFFQAQLPIWLEASLHIKQAGGLQRGKSDSIDAQRIAEYAYRFQDRTRLWKPARPVMKKLAEFTRLRQRLQGMISQLKVPLAEQKRFGDKALTTQLGQHCSSSLKALLSDLKGVEKAIKQLIADDPTLKALFELVTSIPGVGQVVATELILASDEFKAIDDPKKLACHAGVAPFEHSSGSSVRGKTRVNHHARKSLKTLLHMAAMSALQMPGELQEYYQRKVKEGKNKMLVINALRNKLIHRVYAVVKRGKKYNKNYTPTLV